MDSRWSRVSALFEAAMERDPRERLSFVRASSEDDSEVAREVESMLAEIDRPQLIDQPALETAAVLLASDTLVGSQVGPYRIESLLGAGGMGEVYRATDTVLGRQVAIKILPAVLAEDPERLARFHREARLLAALNHPNISAIYGAEALSEQGARTQALVLELVEGPTLADRLESERLSIDDAVGIARQLVDALEAAHRQGIVHRDLKPSNVTIGSNGIVKVLDFGLAKLTQHEGDKNAADTTVSPTITAPHLVTGAGVLLGTAAYMSPEQAKGREADQRSDIWAFGCVLFEMLTGHRAFDGEDPIEVLGAVVRIDPNWSALPPDVPAPLRTLLEGCLVKDRRRRIGDMSTARFVLDHLAALNPSAIVPAGPPTTASARPYVLAALTIATLASAAIAIAVWWWTRPVAPGVVRFAISPTGAAAVNVDAVSRDVAILPDGGHIAYIARGSASSGPRLYVRALDELEPKTIVTIGTPRAPFASADGKSIAYVALGAGGAPALNVVALAGGATSTLCRIDGQSRGVTWGDDGQVIFATSNVATGLQRVSEAGGTPETLTTPDVSKGESDHLWPEFLPGGRAVLFTMVPAQGGDDARQIWLLDLGTGNKKLILPGGSQAHYVPSGHLVYARSGALHAVRFDLTRLEAVGQPLKVVDGIAILPNGTAEFDVSRNGTLIFIPPVAPVNQARTMVLVDRTGREEPVDGAPARASTFPRLSPTGQQIVFDSRDGGSDIWIFDRERKTTKQLTFGAGIDRTPIWTPRGDRIVYASQPDSRLGFGVPFSRAVDGTGMALPLIETAGDAAFAATSISPDEAHVVASALSGADRASDLLLIDTRRRRVVPIIPNASTDRNAEISPDGRWLAFESDRDGGRFGIYVVPFPDVGRALYRISDGAGGLQPAWAPHGKELFYVGLDRTMRSVPVDGVNWPARPPQPLFTANYFLGFGVIGRAYDVSHDGRFLMLKEAAPSETVAPASIVVTQNWTEDLKRLARH